MQASCSRAVAISENPGEHVVLGGDNVPPLVEIGLTGLPKTGGARAPPAPPLATGLLCNTASQITRPISSPIVRCEVTIPSGLAIVSKIIDKNVTIHSYVNSA